MREKEKRGASNIRPRVGRDAAEVRPGDVQAENSGHDGFRRVKEKTLFISSYETERNASVIETEGHFNERADGFNEREKASMREKGKRGVPNIRPGIGRDATEVRPGDVGAESVAHDGLHNGLFCYPRTKKKGGGVSVRMPNHMASTLALLDKGWAQA